MLKSFKYLWQNVLLCDKTKFSVSFILRVELSKIHMLNDLQRFLVFASPKRGILVVRALPKPAVCFIAIKFCAVEKTKNPNLFPSGILTTG